MIAFLAILICPFNVVPLIKKRGRDVELSRARFGFWPLISVSELFMAERSGPARDGIQLLVQSIHAQRLAYHLLEP